MILFANKLNKAVVLRTIQNLRNFMRKLWYREKSIEKNKRLNMPNTCRESKKSRNYKSKRKKLKNKKCKR